MQDINIVVKSNSEFHASSVDYAIQQQNEVGSKDVSNDRKTKRRRIEADQPGCPVVNGKKEERITLLKRELLFDIEGINGANNLKELLAVHGGSVELPVSVKMSPKEAKKGKGQEKFTVICDFDALESVASDFHAATAVAVAHRMYKTGATRGSEFEVQMLLRLGFDLAKMFSVQLMLTLGIAASNEWTTSSRAVAEYWWETLAYAFPEGKPNMEKVRLRGKWSRARQTISAGHFYNSVTSLLKDSVPPAILHRDLQCTLLPFQRRTVRWMLRREGYDVQAGSEKITCYTEHDIPPLFFKTVDALGNTCYVSHVLGIVSTDLDFIIKKFSIRGGILAEEMGLGKTVELIALITLNRRPISGDQQILDEYSGKLVYPSSATLIITPVSILQQWAREIALHAPHLKAFHYQGMMKHKADLTNELLNYDVILTTYDVCSSELYFTQPLPDRQLRPRAVVRKPMRSPLVQISWWRVCLDEAQMIESGVSNAATVAREIPRINAWCVTGTPVRKDLSDLLGLLVFLRCEPVSTDTKTWKSLLYYNLPSFEALFGRLTIRHTKNEVRDELYLPPQKRVIITIPFSHVEEENYDWLFDQMVRECQITADGIQWPGDGGKRDAMLETMRRWLVRLRQVCSHAQAGRWNRQGHNAGNNLVRTIVEVLDQMIEQHLTQLRTDERILFLSILKRGQVLEHYEKFNEALATYMLANKQLQPVVLECRKRLADEQDAGTKHKIGKEKARAIDEHEDAVSDDDDELDSDDDFKERTKLGMIKARLRNFLEVEHAVLFFLGGLYYQMKTAEKLDPESNKFLEYTEMENVYYESAKLVRKELLTETEKMTILELRGGIETQTILEELQSIQDELNVQANHLDGWREQLIQILITPLVDQNEDAKGDEFEESVNKQAEGFAYMEALKTVVADREQALSGRRNMLVEEDLARALARDETYTDLLKKLIMQRNSFKPQLRQPMKALLSRLRTVIATLKSEEIHGNHRAEMERKLAEEVMKQAQATFNAQAKATSKLERELELFRNTINARVDFYRQLQVVSDSVVPFNPEQEPEITLESVQQMKREEDFLAAKIAQARAKERYLSHLRSADSEESRTCIICQTTFEEGTLTICGHQYCTECLSAWFKQAHTCPMCKRRLRQVDMHPITYTVKEVEFREEKHHTSAVNGDDDAVHALYSDIQDAILQQIKLVPIEKSFGSKIDMICKHLLWITKNNPEEKAVVFSQWRDVLAVFERAFRENGIGYATFEKDGVNRFQNDPSIKCFLLHAKSQSAGLTLVNASHVFICEPLLNPGLELQAISRVHRIGQTKPTTVWLYVVNGTVEQAVLNLSTQRRLALMGLKGAQKEISVAEITEAELDKANSKELQQPGTLVDKIPGGGEVVADADLLECLLESARVKLNSKAANGEVRRNLMADAAEKRVGTNMELALGAAGPSRI
ncbi:SNF2 family N-terminal domain-containing protein [Kalaharituber pfeilii]|nr:SNF2 family N-terminal domain-containing protein [Kalaharituber pfeilii]